jgi:hypothetical protein
MTFNRRSYLVDRLYALWWTVVFEAAPEAWAQREQAEMIAELETLPE